MRALVFAVCALPIYSAGAPARPAPFSRLADRVVFAKPAASRITFGERSDRVVVKFREGTHVRSRFGELVPEIHNLNAVEMEQLRRANVTISQLSQEITYVNDLIQANSNLHLERLFTRPEVELEVEKREGEMASGQELADLNLYYHLEIDHAQQAQTEALIDQLNALGIVEMAYPAPIPQPAAIDIDPPTPSFIANQGYRNAAPQGIDAQYALTVAGGGGEGVRIIDIEGGWNLAHEDLSPAPPVVFFDRGTHSTDPGWVQHGTAVLGEIAADDNAYGVSGIAPQAQIGVSSIFPDGVADAINGAAGGVGPGDILLIELHAPGPSSGRTCTCNCGQFEYIPLEYWQAEFDAIQTATALGIVVVEAGGNGSMDLDSAIYDGRFDRTVRDSGAILVGAGTSTGRVPQCWTNFGDRIDVQGWGDSVMTLGYGDIRINGPDDRQWYTRSFSGTSSASPIVVGAAADVNGVQWASGVPVLSSVEMRDLLRRTGTPQGDDPRQIGPLPDLQRAIDELLSPSVTLVTPSTGVTTGGTSVEIRGTNFAPGAVVFFGDSAAPSVTFIDEGTLNAITPAHDGGPVEVRVIVNGRSGSLANAFTYLHPAQVMSIVDATILQ